MTGKLKQKYVYLMEKQSSDKCQVCPRCGMTSMPLPICENPESIYHPGIHICSHCADIEKNLLKKKKHSSLADWYYFWPSIHTNDYCDIPSKVLREWILPKYIEELKILYRFWKKYPDNDLEYIYQMIDACPGIWDISLSEPFSISFLAVDAYVIIDFSLSEDNSVEYSIRTIKRRNEKFHLRFC